MAGKPVKVAFLADTADLRSNLAKAEQAMDSAADEARSAGQKIDTAFDSTADSADRVASKGAQAAGALSGLGELVGGKFGAAMQGSAIAFQAVADGGDLLNVVTESNIVRKVKDTAVTIGQTAATWAKTAADKAAAAGAKAWAGAQWLLNAAMTANPIGLVIVGIVALVAAFVVAYKKSETFRKVVNAAFGAVAKAARAAFDWIQDKASAALGWIRSNWKTVLSILTGPIGIAVLVISRNWDKIKDGAGRAKDFVRDKFDSLVGFFKSMPGRITGAASGLWDGISDSFRSMLNRLIGWWNNLSFSLPGISKGPIKIPGFTISTPNIPYLASGGIVTRPTLAVVGEAGPEAVVPLNGRYGVGNTYIIKVEAGVGDPAEIGRVVTRCVDAYEAQGGRRRAS